MRSKYPALYKSALSSVLIILATVINLVSVSPVLAAGTVSITASAQETMWVDANKPAAEGPRGAWLCYIIKNTGATTLTNVTVTFAGFTGANASYFVVPSDLVRYYSTLAPSQQVPIYFYVDYSDVLNHPGGGGKFSGYTANFTVSVSSSTLTTNPTVYNGTITTDELLSAAAAGITQSTSLGPGIYVGQILTQTVVYAFGNNSNLFFQPASEWRFQDEVIRLVGSEITAKSAGVTGVNVGDKDRLWYPTASVSAGDETITLTYYWQILEINIAQTAHPWAAAKSGQQYKYAGIVTSTIGYDTITPALPPLSISKSVNPAYLAADNTSWPVEYTVTFTNSAPVPIVVDNITDVLPVGVKMLNSTATGSGVTVANSTSVPAANSTGTVHWVGKTLSYSENSTYSVPASGTLALKYTVDVSSLGTSMVPYSNSATGVVALSTVGPDSADLYIGYLPAPVLTLVKTVTEADYSAAGSALHYTLVAKNTGTGTAGSVCISDNLVSNLAPAYPQNANLAAGENLTVTGTHTITQADLDRGYIVNGATASGTTPSGGTLSATDNVTVYAVQTPGIMIVKTGNLNTDFVSPAGAANPGDNITYSFMVTNTGNVTLASVSVSDNIVTSITPSPVTLAPSASQEFTGTYIIKQEDIDSGSVSNKATVSGTPPGGPPPITATDIETVTIPQVSSLSVAKAGTLNTAGSYAAPGDNITYVIMVTNTGNIPLTNVSITDPMLSNIAPASYASLTPGASENFTGTYILTQTNINAGSVSNTATGTGTSPTGPVTNTGTTTVNIPQQKSMSAVKAGVLHQSGVNPAPGDNITYTVTVTNTGNVTLTNVHVTDTLLDGNLSPSSLTLLPGASGDFTGTYFITQVDIDRGHVDNTATAYSNQSDPAESNHNSVVVSAEPGIHLDKEGTLNTGSGGTAQAGDNITYVFTVTNTGGVTLYTVGITDTLIHSGIKPDSYPTIAPGASENFTGTYILTQNDINTGSVVNTATAEAATPGGPKVSDNCTETVYITQYPSIVVIKTGVLHKAGIYPAAGDNITYTFTVTNTGNVTLADVRVSDTLIVSGITPTSYLSLDPGASENFTGTYILEQTDINNGSASNTATARGKPPLSTEYVTGTGSSTVDITQSASMSVVKAGILHMGSGTPALGDNITYTVTVTNTGNVTLANLSVEDTLLDSHLAPPSIASLAPGASENFTGTYLITATDIDLGRVDNTATATGTRPGGSQISQTGSTSVPLTQAPSMAIAKTGVVNLAMVDPPNVVNVGDKIDYTITVTNTGNVTLTNVAVQDSLLSNLTPNWPGPAGTLGAGQSATFTGSYTLTQADINNGHVDNTATATSDQAPQVQATRSISITVVPGIAIQKVGSLNLGGNAYASAGNVINYTFTVTNTGNVTLTNVTVTDPRVSNIQPASVASLAPGVSATFTGRYTLTQGDVNSGAVINTATGTGTLPGGLSVTGAGSCTIAVPGRSLMGTGNRAGGGGSSTTPVGTRPYLPVMPTANALSITPQSALVNQPMTVRAQISNAGLDKSKYTAILKVNGEVEGYCNGIVNGQSTVAVAFPLTLKEKGDYLIDINGQQAYINVKDQDVSIDNIISYIPIIGFIICALGIVLVSILLVRRNRFDHM